MRKTCFRGTRRRCFEQIFVSTALRCVKLRTLSVYKYSLHHRQVWKPAWHVVGRRSDNMMQWTKKHSTKVKIDTDLLPVSSFWHLSQAENTPQKLDTSNMKGTHSKWGCTNDLHTAVFTWMQDNTNLLQHVFQRKLGNGRPKPKVAHQRSRAVKIIDWDFFFPFFSKSKPQQSWNGFQFEQLMHRVDGSIFMSSSPQQNSQLPLLF